MVRLGVGQELFTLDQAKSVRATLGEDTDLLTFAQQLIDDAYVNEDRLGDLEQLAGIAMRKGNAGPPDEDPLAPESETAVAEPTPPPAELEPVAAPAPEVRSSVPDPAPTPTGTVAAGELDFDNLGSLSYDALADQLRGFLVLCGDEGVSDLHLCASNGRFLSRRTRHYRGGGSSFKYRALS